MPAAPHLSRHSSWAHSPYPAWWTFKHRRPSTHSSPHAWMCSVYHYNISLIVSSDGTCRHTIHSIFAIKKGSARTHCLTFQWEVWVHHSDLHGVDKVDLEGCSWPGWTECVDWGSRWRTSCPHNGNIPTTESNQISMPLSAKTKFGLTLATCSDWAYESPYSIF